MIVTKSVSRFARNTVDSLTTIRKLKEHGTEVYFEKENIWTFDSKGELLLTIMSSLAQEESRSISENVRWGQRKRAADGKYSLGYAPHTITRCTPLDRSCTYLHPRKASGVHRFLVSTVPFPGLHCLPHYTCHNMLDRLLL